MAATKLVALWDASATVGYADLFGAGSVTDVFFRESRPARGTVMIGTVPVDFEDGRSITVCGVITAVQQVATGKDRVTIQHLRSFTPLDLNALRAAIPDPALVRSPAPLHTVRLDAAVSDRVLTYLAAQMPGFGDWLASLSYSGAQIPKTDGQRIREERDATSLAIDLSEVSVPDDALLTTAADINYRAPLAGVFDPAVIADTEDDLLAEDLRRFDPRGVLSLESASVARFVDHDFTLTIMNVNRKPLEHVLGVDLIYWDEVANTFTLIQYKRLTKRTTDPGRRDDERWGYRRREDLEAQLALMDLGDSALAGSSDWRMTPSPFWFKFVKDDDFVPNDPFVLRGMYVPAEYLRAAIVDGSLQGGPRAGFEVTYANTRYITRNSFIELVRRRFTGTTAAMSRAVVSVAQARSANDEVVLAIRSKTRRNPKPAIEIPPGMPF